jgi:predicted signal transduction protein with EAL and GGDEF domain
VQRYALAGRAGKFTVILPELHSHGHLELFGKRIIERAEEPIPFKGEDYPKLALIGTVRIDASARPIVSDLLADADLALYASKQAGRACQTFYHEDLRADAGGAARGGLLIQGQRADDIGRATDRAAGSA